MGHFNLNSGHNELLKTGICVVCERNRTMPSKLEDYARMTFDYVCRYCNPDVEIRITDGVLMSNLLSELSKNPEARSNLKEEISAMSGGFFRIDTTILNYYLGITKKSITYEDWIEGKVVGNIKNWDISSEDLEKIRTIQLEIFESRVLKRLHYLTNSFETRREKSIDQKYMLTLELSHVNSILIKGTHKFGYKLTSNEPVTIGIHNFRSYSVFKDIQLMYEHSVSGLLDLSIVPSEKQKVGVASLAAKVQSMVEAVAYGKYRQYLEGLQSNNETQKTKFTDVDIRDLERKIDELKDIIQRGFSNNNAAQSGMLFELQRGQEVIYNELEELKSTLPTLSKKNWFELVKGKLFDLVLKQVISKDTAEFILQKLKDAGIEPSELTKYF